MSDSSERVTAKIPRESPEERARLLALIESDRAKEVAPKGEPLPIGSFVGALLAVCGLALLVSGVVTTPRTVLAETRPALWWGALMCAAGLAFLGIGLAGRRR